MSNEWDLEERASSFLKQHNPYRPSDKLIEVGKSTLIVAKELANIGAAKERFVLIENQAKDIAPHMATVRAKYDTKGNILEHGHGEVLFFNLHFVEFLADLIVFQAWPEKETFLHILGKYSRFFTPTIDHTIANFYNWIFIQHINTHSYEYQMLLPKAGAGSVFLLIHEWLHKQPELVDATSNLLLQSNKVKELCADFDRKQIEEMCCDFSALVFISRYNYETFFNCTKTEMLGISLLSLSVSGIYALLYKIRINSNSGEEKTLADSLFKALNERMQMLALVVRIACNSNLYFDNCDVESAMKYALGTVRDFFVKSSDCYTEDITKLVDEFNAMTDEEREKYVFSIPYDEWYLFA